MISHRKLGSILVTVLPLINVVLWIVFPPFHDGSLSDYGRRYIGEIIGSTMMIMMSLSLLLATRLRFLEPFFNGLDKMYLVHRNAGATSTLLLILHFIIMPLVPGEVPPGRAPGYIAFGGLLILIMLSLAPRLPGIRKLIRMSYRQWRITHKFIGIFFVMGTAHTLLVDPLVLTTTVPFVVLMIAITIGIASYLYTELIARFARRTARYDVHEVNHLNDKVVEVVLLPVKKRLEFTAGQFLFVRFKGNRVLSEPHPFTISSSPGENNLRLTISSTGDFTNYLYHNLKPKTRAVVEGCYGMMDYRKGNTKQIWIAGGIGVTPFLSWIRDIAQELPYTIDFYYSVRTQNDALYLNEILAAANNHSNFRVHIHYSATMGRFTTSEIVGSVEGSVNERDIYMCGPSPMLAAFQREFRRLGISTKAIHYEEFSFR